MVDAYFGRFVLPEDLHAALLKCRSIAYIETQEELDEREYSAQAGGGMVSVTVSGKRELKHLEIKPECVDPEDVEMLQDLVVSAVNEALRQANDAMENSMNGVTGGLDLSSFGL